VLNVNLNGAEKRMWDLHMQGFAPSRVAKMTGVSEERVRSVITGVWFDDKMAAREAKRKRAA